MGRPSKLTPELVERMRDVMQRGVPLDAAAALCGISETTLHKYQARGRAEIARIAEGGTPRKAEELYVEFVGSIKGGRSYVEADAISAIMSAWRNGQWQAAAWWLERTQPEKYAKTVKDPGREEAAGEVVKAIELLVKTADR